MVTQSDIIADLHTHTIFSKHAYSTIQENIAAAQKMNLKYLAITDHIYNDGTLLDIKNEGTRCRHLEKEVNSHREEGQPYVISGGEFNIAQKLDHWDKFKRLKWRPIGLHGFKLDIKQLSLNDLYQEFKKAAEKHNAFAHIERELQKVEHYRHRDKLDDEIKSFFEAIVDLAVDKNIFLEVNESSLRNDDDGNVNKIKYWISLAREKDCKIYLASDAHYSSRVGKFPLSIELLNDIDYPKELILNCNEENLVNTMKLSD